MSSSYSLGYADVVLRHFPAENLYVRDSESGNKRDAADDFLLHARVRSDDYFSTVATELDQVIESMSQGAVASALAPELERIVDELIKVGKSYKLVPRR